MHHLYLCMLYFIHISFPLSSCVLTNVTADADEKDKIDLLKMYVEPFVEADYMKDSAFLQRFLTASDFDVEKALKTFTAMVKWRKEENIDALLHEDFPEFDSDYQIFIEGCDHLDRPVISIPFGYWDIRDAVISGHGERLKQYMNKIFEDATSFLQSVNQLGVKVDAGVLIIDLDGFDMQTHGCPKCLLIYRYFFETLKLHYPGLIEKIYFINNPQIVTFLFSIYNDTFTPDIMKIVDVLGIDRATWEPKLTNEIETTQLSKDLGGVKEDHLDFIVIRHLQTLIAAFRNEDAIKIKGGCSHNMKLFEVLSKSMDKVFDQRRTYEVEKEKKRKERCYKPLA